ncbi:MAG: protein-export chaperone SecB [Pseudomonadota bacterium]
MADQNETSETAASSPAEPPVQVRVVSQFIKDVSFENPSVERMLKGPAEEPQLKLEVNVNARHMEGSLFESVIDFHANATSKDGVIYALECTYGGVFEIRKMPKDAVEPFLLVNCPALLFPFLRRLAADITREGGFPPLLLDPIDFGQLYMKRKQEEQAGATPNGKTN